MKRFLLPAAIVVMLVVAGAWKLTSNKQSMAANAAMATKKTTVFPVMVTSPEVTTLSNDVEASGHLAPVHLLDLVSDVSGRVVELARDNGDMVTRGQLVVQVDNEQLRIDLKQANAALDQARRDLENYTAMQKSNAVSAQDVANARLAVVNAETRVATLTRQLRNTSIVSTITGSVNDCTIEVGSYLSPGTRIARIADVSTLIMHVRLRDNEVLRIRKGQTVALKPDLDPTMRIEGTVSAIGTIADGAGTYDVEISVPNRGKSPLLAGMTGRARFTAKGNHPAMVIPSRCLVGGTQQPSVYVVDNGKASLRPVTVGMRQDDVVEVLSGLGTNDKVVTSGQLNIADGSAVSIVR